MLCYLRCHFENEVMFHVIKFNFLNGHIFQHRLQQGQGSWQNARVACETFLGENFAVQKGSQAQLTFLIIAKKTVHYLNLVLQFARRRYKT